MTGSSDWSAPIGAPEPVAAEAWTPVPLAGPDAVPAPPHGFAEAEFTEDEVPVDAAEDRINVEAMVESAYASGYEDGVTEGERMARERLDGAVRALEIGRAHV